VWQIPQGISSPTTTTFLPFRHAQQKGIPKTPGNQVLVTKAYDTMYDGLLRLRVGGIRGALITGQPGTGAPRDQIRTPFNNSPLQPFSRENQGF
jgi:hypothetical protein